MDLEIKNDPEEDLEVSLSADSYSVVEGSDVKITLAFAEAIARSSAQRPTAACTVAAEWEVMGLQPGDYHFDAPSIISYLPSQSSVSYTLKLNEDRIQESAENIDVTVKLSQGGDNPCPLSDNVLSTRVNLPNTIVVTDDPNTDSSALKANEPEVVIKKTCDAIRTYAAADFVPVGERDVTVRNFFTALLAGDLSSDNRRVLEDRLQLYINTCWDRGSIEANNERDRNAEPEEVVSQGKALLNGAERQVSNVRARLNKLRSSDGDRGLDVSDIELNILDAAIPSAVTGDVLGGAAGDDIDSLFEETRWGAFANGEYAFGDKNRGDDRAPGSGDRNFDFNSKGLTVGADYRFPGEKFIAGAALGYKDFEAEFSSQGGGTSNKGYNFSVYGTYLLSEKSYFDAIISYGKNKIDSTRPINNGAIINGVFVAGDPAFANGNPDASETSISVGGGYDFQLDEWTLTPYGRVDYTKGTVEAYQEESSVGEETPGLYGIDEQTLESLSSSLGIKASRVISTSSGVYVPQASIEWKHEFKERDLISGQALHLVEEQQLEDGGIGVAADFAEGNSVNRTLDTDYFNVNVGVSAVFPEGRSAFMNVESRFGDDTTSETAVKAGYRWEFY